jgi:serine phosphatase RsbU (regulator of sigma subunit)
MKKFLNIELSGIQKSLLYVLAISSILIKIIFDSLFLLIEQYDQPFPLLLRLIFSLVFFISIFILFFSDFKLKLSHKYTNFESYTSELLRIIFFYFILLIFSSLLPKSIIGGNDPQSLIEIVYINAFAVAAIILSLMTLLFFFKWIWHRRFKWTKKHIKITIVLIAAIILLLDLPNHFSHLDPDEIKDNTFIFSLSIILNISLIIVSFFASKKKEWIASLTLTDKWKVFGMSLAVIILTIVTFAADAQFEGDGKLSNALNTIFPAGSLFGISTLILLVYSVRIFFAAMLSIPTSGIIERKYSDLNSLTYLNRVIAHTIDFNSLIDTVSNLCLVSGSGNIVWTDTISEDGKYIIHSLHSAVKLPKSKEYFIKELEREFYSDKSLDSFRNLVESYHIESIPEYQNTAIQKLNKIFNAKSLLIVPMMSASERIGTLYLIHPSEYGFDRDFLTLLSAFSDNLNIAIENIRLLEESIEKEKFKKELKIARDIEQKLIPTEMPDIANYSLAGYTIPADEVGGDYYDIIHLKDGKPCLLIGDVSGKGMSAAFYMVLLKGVVLSVGNQAETASELLKKINCVLHKEMEKQMFITMSAVKIEDESGNISLARAGHMPFLIKTKQETLELKPKGIGIGLTSPAIFDKALEEISYKLSPNDNLLMYSDGAVEIFKDNTELKPDFLKQIINNSVYINSKELLNEIKLKIDELRKEYRIIDDMTLVCLTYSKQENTEIDNA